MDRSPYYHNLTKFLKNFYLKNFGLLSEHQYGFRPNSSTALAVEDICSNLLANHNKGLHTCSLCIDCSKAFDTVDREILLKKWKGIFELEAYH